MDGDEAARLRAEACAMLAAAEPTLACSELVRLLSHAAEPVRSLAAWLLAHRLGASDAVRAALLARWAPEWLSSPLLPEGLLAEAPSTATLPTSDIERTLAAGGLVHTDHAAAVLRSMAVALGSARPVLLAGPPGAGKTSLLNALAADLGKLEDMVVVHLDEQVLELELLIRNRRAWNY